MTPALLQVIMTAAPLSMSVLLLRSVEQYGIGQAGHHLREARIVRRAVIDVAIDGLEPAFDVAARDAVPRQASERLRWVNEEVHLGWRALAGQRHEVAKAREPEAAEASVEALPARPERAVVAGFPVGVDLQKHWERASLGGHGRLHRPPEQLGAEAVIALIRGDGHVFEQRESPGRRHEEDAEAPHEAASLRHPDAILGGVDHGGDPVLALLLTGGDRCGVDRVELPEGLPLGGCELLQLDGIAHSAVSDCEDTI